MNGGDIGFVKLRENECGIWGHPWRRRLCRRWCRVFVGGGGMVLRYVRTHEWIKLTCWLT